jgi:Tfp pilus assembly protein PilX
MMKQQNGLSSVELIVALLVAGLFLISGYQLYTYVFRNGTQTAQQAEASNVAYAAMRKKAASITSQSVCVDSGSPTIENYTGTTIPSATISTSVSCPYTTSSLDIVSKITVTVTYTDSEGTKTVTHAMLKS